LRACHSNDRIVAAECHRRVDLCVTASGPIVPVIRPCDAADMLRGNRSVWPLLLALVVPVGCDDGSKNAEIARLEAELAKCQSRSQPSAATTSPTAAPKTRRDEVVVTTFKGNGAQAVRPFKVEDRWEIRWNANGMLFQAMLHSADGSLVGIVANQQGTGKGSAFRPKGGEYFLKTNAMGSWTIEIVQLP
jgi:hypothetical protein